MVVFGGAIAKEQPVSSVEMLSADGRMWQMQPTAMFAADWLFESVPLP